MKNVVMSVRRELMPDDSARSRLSVTARMRRPMGVNFIAAMTAATQVIARTKMNTRVRGTDAPSSSTLPRRNSGTATLTAGAPQMSRAICCRTRPTPKVTSRVSSGRA